MSTVAYFRSAPIMAYPAGRILRQVDADTLEVWEGRQWHRTSRSTPPTNALPVTASEIETEIGPREDGEDPDA